MSPASSFLFFFFRRLFFYVIKPRIRLRSWYDPGDIRIDAWISRHDFVTPLFGFLAAYDFLFLLLSPRPLAFAFASS